MHTTRLLMLVAIVFAVTQPPMHCSGKKNKPDPAPVAVPKARIDASVDPSAFPATFTLDSLKINHDTLSAFVNYSGGCAEQQFDLLSNGLFAKSMPPQLTIGLLHDRKGDQCRALVMKELRFDITAFRRPGSTQGTVILKLADQSIEYTY